MEFHGRTFFLLIKKEIKKVEIEKFGLISILLSFYF